MSEKRLIEITTEICKSKDPLWLMGYIASLNSSDIYLLLRYVSGSKYKEMNLYDALSQFSSSYLKSKDIVLETEEVSFKEGQTDGESYISRMLAGDSSIKIVKR